MEANAWEYELSLFTEDLIASLLSRHPELQKLPCKRSGSLYFTEEIGKCVLLTWRDKKNELDQFLEKGYPSFVESKHCFKQYLERFVESVTGQKEQSVTSQILGLSAILLGILFFLHRKGLTHFVHDASSYLFFMLSGVKAEKFYEEGGWSHLASVSAKLSDDYDEETCRQFISANVCSLSSSDAAENIKIDSTLECPVETLSGKTLQPDISMFHHSKEKCENYSEDDEKEISIGVSEKQAQEVVSVPNKSEDEPEKDSTNEEITLIKEKHSEKVVSILNKPEDEIEKDSVNKEVDPNEVALTISQGILSDLNKSEDKPKKDSTNEEITLVELKEKHSEKVVSVLNKPEDEKDSANNEVYPSEVTDTISQEVVSDLNKSEDKRERDSTNEEITLNEVKEKHYQVPILNKSEDESKENSSNKETTSNEVKDLSHEAVMVSYEPEEKPRNNSTKLNSTLYEVTTEIESTSLKHPNVLREEPPTTLSFDLTSTVSKELTALSQTSVHKDVLESPLESEKEFQLTDSSLHLSSNLIIPPKTFESLKVEEKFPAEESKTSLDSNKSSGGVESMHCTVDSTKLRDCPSKPSETSPTDCELVDEVDKFLTDEILSNFQVRFIAKYEEIEAIKFISVDTARKDNVHTLKQDEAVQTDFASSNNIPMLKNLAKTEMLSTPKKSSDEHICTDDSATKKDSSLFKSPKHETNKKATPFKAKTPSSEKRSVKDTKNKTAASNDSVTPIKTPRTPKSSTVSSTGKMTETKTAKSLNSPASKSSSPCFKAPTDKGVHSKSCEKTEQSRNLLLPKASTEITKSLPKSTSAANTKAEGKTTKSSIEHLDAKSCKEETSSHIKKSDQNIGNEPSTARANITNLNAACRTRIVHGKNTSTDSKNEKPRWR